MSPSSSARAFLYAACRSAGVAPESEATPMSLRARSSASRSTGENAACLRRRASRSAASKAAAYSATASRYRSNSSGGQRRLRRVGSGLLRPQVVGPDPRPVEGQRQRFPHVGHERVLDEGGEIEFVGEPACVQGVVLLEGLAQLPQRCRGQPQLFGPRRRPDSLELDLVLPALLVVLRHRAHPPADHAADGEDQPPVVRREFEDSGHIDDSTARPRAPGTRGACGQPASIAPANWLWYSR
ncbi:Uncharacterised protein [Gordonia paraffinivorans]|uniref:Uncharacterized protein n=1 Tax=Gordonia paraffinivorans TaxID=175628 RepID=A0ABD7V463_9ACTN|nr:Uncharacterised protein [Gordonia paraffinivorans]